MGPVEPCSTVLSIEGCPPSVQGQRERGDCRVQAAYAATTPLSGNEIIRLPGNGIQFTDRQRNRDDWVARLLVHRFDMICNGYGIEHRLTKPNHPWSLRNKEKVQ